VRDPFGRAIDVISATPVHEGNDIFTTIDHTIQANAEQVLRSTIAQWHAQSATAVVINPKTGEVLALAQAPGYNANNASNVPFAVQRNRSVTDTYEPGRPSSSSRSARRCRSASSRPRRGSRCRTASKSPTAPCTTQSRAGRRR
jgi:Cell division protein FtsI/penicillin-binding protein 2